MGWCSMSATNVSDFEFIRKKIFIVSIARELGIAVTGYRARCWRAANHRNGDANPSLSFQKKTNRGMCFVCDQHTWSTIDLVMLYLDCELPAAISWIVRRFPVPSLSPGTHVKKREGWNPNYYRGVDEDAITTLVHSGVWAQLTHAERSVLPVLQTFVQRDSGVIEISYRGIMRHSGVGSHATVAKAISTFERMRLLRVARKPGELIFRGVNQYVLTLDDPEFQTLMARTYQSRRAAINLEKELRAKAKEEKAKERKARSGRGRASAPPP